MWQPPPFRVPWRAYRLPLAPSIKKTGSSSVKLQPNQYSQIYSLLSVRLVFSQSTFFYVVIKNLQIKLHELVVQCLQNDQLWAEPTNPWISLPNASAHLPMVCVFAQIYPGNPQNDSNLVGFCCTLVLLWTQLSDSIKHAVVWEVNNSMTCKFQIGLLVCVHCFANIRKHALQADSAAHLKIMYVSRWVGLCFCSHVDWKFLYRAHLDMTATICIASCPDGRSGK